MEQLKNVVDFELPKEKKIIKKDDSLPDKRKFIVLPFNIVNYKLTRSEYWVLLSVASYCNKGGLTWVTHQRLADDLKVSRQFITKVMKQLKDKGIIEIISRGKEGLKGNTFRIIYEKDSTVEDIVAVSSDKNEDTRTPKMKEEAKQSFTQSSPYDDLTEVANMTKEEFERGKKRVAQFKGIFKFNPNIKKGELVKVGDMIDKEKAEEFQQELRRDIEMEKKKKQSNKQPLKVAKEKKPLATKKKSLATNSKGLATPESSITIDNNKHMLTIDIIINIYNNYILTYGYATETKITEEDMKASELMIESGMKAGQLEETLKELKEYKPLVEVLLEVSNKYTF